MASANSTSPRSLPFVLGAIGIVTLIIAVFHTPIGEWNGGAYVFGAVLLLVSVMWLYLGFRGSYNLMGRLSPRTGLMVSSAGAVAAGVVLGVTIFTDEWTVQTVVTTGLWAMLAVMFVAGFIVSSRQAQSAG